MYTVCPQLKSSHHLLAIRLSKSLINRRQFLRKTGKLPVYIKAKTSRSNATVQVSSNLSKYLAVQIKIANIDILNILPCMRVLVKTIYLIMSYQHMKKMAALELVISISMVSVQTPTSALGVYYVASV